MATSNLAEKVLQADSLSSMKPYVALPNPRRRFKREEYDRIALTGLFEGQRVELIEGEVFCMSPIGTYHNVIVDIVDEKMKKVFSRGYRVRVQSSFIVPVETELEPDIAVVPGKARDYLLRHPDTAILIIEVADSSLEYDTVYKAGLYAQAGIADYWVINLKQPSIIVHRSPVPMPDRSFGYGYTDVRILLPQDTISPLARPQTQFSVSELLP